MSKLQNLNVSVIICVLFTIILSNFLSHFKISDWHWDKTLLLWTLYQIAMETLQQPFKSPWKYNWRSFLPSHIVPKLPTSLPSGGENFVKVSKQSCITMVTNLSDGFIFPSFYFRDFLFEMRYFLNRLWSLLLQSFQLLSHVGFLQ